MIRHYDELTKLDMQHKGGKGHILAAELLNGEDFAGKGRVFNHCVLKDGEEHMLENDGTEDLEFIALILYA